VRRAVGIFSIAIAPLFAGALAFADDRPGERGGAAGMAGKMAGMAGYHGQHSMTGRITSIDQQEGKVSIESQGKSMDLHFPPSALQGLNKGDEVTVQLAIKQGAGTTSGMGSGTRGAGERGTTGSGAEPSAPPEGGGTGSRSGATSR
jgi:hypothetical protein